MSEVTTPDGLRKFRFGAGGEGNKEEGGARKFVKLAQTADGYDTFAVPDHLGNQVGPLAALGALSQATSGSGSAPRYSPTAGATRAAGQGGQHHRRPVEGRAGWVSAQAG